MTQPFAVALRRTIPGARAEVYRAFLDPALLQRWMCPDDYVVATAEVDERVGGRHVVEMLSPRGDRLAFESVIRELVPDERIVLDFRFVGPEKVPETTRFAAAFADAPAGATDVLLEHERLVPAPNFDPPSVNAGWTSVLDKLEALYERS